MPKTSTLFQKGTLVFILIGIASFQGCGKSPESLKITPKSTSILSDDGPIPGDTQAPAIAILTPQSNTYVKPPAQISGSCESNLVVSYNLDGTSVALETPCTNSVFSIALADSLRDGNYSAWVSQIDAAGNKTQRTVQFMIDRVAPVVTLQSPTGTLSTSSSVTLRGTCEGTRPVQLSGSALSAPVSATCANSAYVGTALFASSAGARVIQASQSDLAGNEGTVSLNVTLVAPSTPAPQVTITAPAANALLNNRSISLQGTCQTGLTVSISGAGVSATSSATCTSGNFQSSIQLSATDGLKNVVVSQTNTQGQTGQASRSFQLDMTAPALSIQSPAAGAQSETGITLVGNCESGIDVTVAGSGASASSAAVCTSGMFRSIVTFSSGVGAKLITASQRDAAGNTSTISRSFERIGAPAIDGWDLYNVNCSVCHRGITGSTKLGASAESITTAISSVRQMQGLVLSAAEINAIAYALANPNGRASSRVSEPLVLANVDQARSSGTSSTQKLSTDEILNLLNEHLHVSPSASWALAEDYSHFVQLYSSSFVSSTAQIRNLAGCNPSGPSDRACYRKFLIKVGGLLLRRPLTSGEIWNYEPLLGLAIGENNFYVAPGALIQKLLLHPDFLKRSETTSATNH